MKFILYAFRVTIGTYTVLNRSNWTGISTRFNMELVVSSTKACNNVSMANISNIRNIGFVSKYKLKFSICPKFQYVRYYTILYMMVKVTGFIFYNWYYTYMNDNFTSRQINILSIKVKIRTRHSLKQRCSPSL